MGGIQGFLAGWALATAGYIAALFVTCDAVQRFLYDEVVQRLWLRVLAVSVPLGALVVWWPVPFFDKFDQMLGGGVVHAAAWWPVIWLVMRFQWHHALALALLTGFLAAPIVTTALTSIGAR